jgi:mannose-6-phosphate isomerase-like protein (cupin superfamily)
MKIWLTGTYGAGKCAEVDTEDYERVNQYSWHLKDGYAVTKARLPNGKRANLQMHRYVLGTTDPYILVDHKDRDRLNNTRSNLREVTPKENANNMSTNRRLVAFGEERTMAQWSEDHRCSVNYYVLSGRITAGFPVELSILAKQGELDGLKAGDFVAAEAEGEKSE